MDVIFWILKFLLSQIFGAEGILGFGNFESYFLPTSYERFGPTGPTSPVAVMKDRSYLVIAPHVVRAGQVYRLVANVLPPSPPLVVRATLFKNNIELDAVEKECGVSYPHLLQIMVPRSSTSGNYRLRLEGSEVGWLSGSAFRNETDLVFSPRGATVLIQTNKKIYKQGTRVLIRIVALDSTVQVVDDAVDVFLLSPRGVLIRRWLSRQCLEGPISLEFTLSQGCELGSWSVRVEATNSFAEVEFVVETFEDPLFQVHVEVPSFLSSAEKHLEGHVTSNYSSGAPVTGNVSVMGSLRPLRGGSMSHYSTENVLLRRQSKFNGDMAFRFRISEMGNILEWSEGLEVKIEAIVGDAVLDATSTGYASVRIFGEDILLRFLAESPAIIRPSMPFQYFLTASLEDGSHVPKSRLLQHRLQVTPEVRFRNTRMVNLAPRTIKMMHGRYGVWDDEIELTTELAGEYIESDIESVMLKAELKDASGFRSYASLVVIPYYSPRGKYLQVSTSTKNPKVGEYIIFHVRSNFYLDKFRYIMLSKGVIVDSGQEHMEASLRTFPVALTHSMAGTTSIIVYAMERGEAMMADSLTFPVDAIVAKDLKVYVEEQKYIGRLKITIVGDPDTRVSLTGSYATLDEIYQENYLRKNKVLERVISDSKPFYPRGVMVHYEEPMGQKWVSNNGRSKDSYIWLPSPSSAGDANQTFGSLRLDILSDSLLPARPSLCKSGRGLLPCLIGGCYSSSSSCDSKWDCVDRMDEKGCNREEPSVKSRMNEYRVRRKSRVAAHFTQPWLWSDVVIERNGFATVAVSSPEKTSNLVLTAFGLHRTNGISLLKEPLTMTTSPPFWLVVEAPSRVVIWEQVGFRVTLANRMDRELPAVIVLTNNPSYRFVSLEDFENAETFNTISQITVPESIFDKDIDFVPIRRMLSGEHEHAVRVPAGETRTVYLPIVPVVTGKITVIVQASLPSSKITRTTQLFVENQFTVIEKPSTPIDGPSQKSLRDEIRKSCLLFMQPLGALQERHTSLLLDLSNRAYLFTFLDMPLPSQSLYNSASLALFGDTVSAAPDGVANSEELLGLPISGGEPEIFGFLLTMLQLKQWKNLNQKPERNDKRAFRQLSVLYQTILSYQSKDGGFKYFETSPTSSTLATSLALRAFHEASSTWPHLLYVDPQVPDKALRFVLRQQSKEGAFWEPDGSVGIRYVDRPSEFFLNQFSTRGLNLSSSAFTLLQLIAIKEFPEPLDKEAQAAIDKGRLWLEKNLSVLETTAHPLEITLVTLVLHLTSSERAEDAFNILSRSAREEAQYLYWAENVVPIPSYRVESQRPHLQPRKFHQHDSGNVAATACGLRVYALRGELLTPAIVRWLQHQRLHNGGWLSTFDTLLAWESLNEYSLRQKQAQHTHLTVTMETLKESSKSAMFYVTPDNLLHLQQFDLGDSRGSIRIQGKGNGSAVLQLTARYYVTDSDHLEKSPASAFALGTSVVSSGRNSSRLTFHSCVLWKLASGGGPSGVAVLEVGIPTGYGITAQELKIYVLSRMVAGLRKAVFQPRKVSFFFDKLERKNTCVKFSVHRWFPVANLTKLLVVKVYEYYSPELFATELVDMSDIILDICQVCGSYQCPNCPVLSYYSRASDPLCSKYKVLDRIWLIVLSLSVFYSYGAL